LDQHIGSFIMHGQGVTTHMLSEREALQESPKFRDFMNYLEEKLPRWGAEIVGREIAVQKSSAWQPLPVSDAYVSLCDSRRKAIGDVPYAGYRMEASPNLYGDRSAIYSLFQLKMKGIQEYRNCLGISLRNHGDGGQTLHMVTGENVLVCDNSAWLSGDHWGGQEKLTSDQQIRDAIDQVLENAWKTFDIRAREVEKLKNVGVKDKQAVHTIVSAVPKRLINRFEEPVVKKEWFEPTLPDFNARNAWSLFNAFTSVKVGKPAIEVIPETAGFRQHFRELLLH